jgi:hypothetical protein
MFKTKTGYCLKRPDYIAAFTAAIEWTAIEEVFGHA